MVATTTLELVKSGLNVPIRIQFEQSLTIRKYETINLPSAIIVMSLYHHEMKTLYAKSMKGDTWDERHL